MTGHRGFTMYLVRLCRRAFAGTAGDDSPSAVANDALPERPAAGCEIIRFPGHRAARRGRSAARVRPVSGLAAALMPARGRCRHLAVALWDTPRTRGAFVLQQLIAIAVAVSLGALFDSMWR